uniref:Uncharacterized protein n=1 Tax=Rhizophora mucronata TaxID=61149 RepID=A0A2P2NVW1_RHIMU
MFQFDNAACTGFYFVYNITTMLCVLRVFLSFLYCCNLFSCSPYPELLLFDI